MGQLDTQSDYALTIHDMVVSERPRERFIQVGERAMSTAELLAIILRTGVDGENVIRLSERMLIRFGGLAGLAQATLAELQELKWVGPAKAIETKAALELGRRLLTSSPSEKPRVSSPADAANLLMSEMALLEQEHLRLILLDTRNHVLSTPTVYIGSLNTSVVRVGELFRFALRENAAAMIVVHNHPSGDPTPSPEDVKVTRQISEGGKILDINVLDHIIIGRQRYCSLKERGLGFD